MEIYTMQTAKTPRRQESRGIYVLAQTTSKGEVSKAQEVSFENVTPNEAEIKLLIKAMERVTKMCDVNIYTESQYIANGFYWIPKWREKHWKTAKGKPIQCAEEWQWFDNFMKVHRCTIFLKVNHSYRKWMKDVLTPRGRYE